MSEPKPRNEETVFLQALELSDAARSTFLADACGRDEALRTSVEALLRAHRAAGSFLPQATPASRELAPAASRREEQPGDWIGRYKVLQKIGEGGCGVVYMAEQEEPVRRRVALKIVKLGMDTKEVIARFAAERQALAMMDHPNIANVFDASTTDAGRPFFAMELVRGAPITQFCDEHGLATAKRLELFSQVCHAIQHAHQKGIIHRDIKPSNVLVTLHDDVPVPKVIDFGIAKATQGKLTDQSYFTAFEQFIGTPAYMSPEQAEMNGLDVDTRSDVYSLGVLLYELLTGRPPFDPKTIVSAGLDEMRRLIREVDPPKPSTRLATLGEKDRTLAAKLRGTVPAQLSMVLVGDLDWIVMRCLEKGRTRRYGTPSEIVADIERHLRNEPVTARPPSTAYLLRKLIRRHQVGVAAGVAVALSLIAGLVLSSILLVRERAARERAVVAENKESGLRREADQARALEAQLRTDADARAREARSAAAKSAQVARFMTDMLSGVGPNVALGRDTKLLREIVDTTVQRLDLELRDQPAVAAELRETLGAVYFDLGHYAAATPLLRAAVETRRTLNGEQSAEAAVALQLLGRTLLRLNKANEAETVLQEALSIRRKIFGSEHLLVADTLAEIAWVPNAQRSAADRRNLLKEVLAIRRKILGNEHPEVASAIFQLGRAAQWNADHVTAEPLHQEALAMRRRLLGNDHPDVAASLDGLGFSYAHELERKEDAAKVYHESFVIRSKVLGPEHPAMLVSLLHLTAQMPARGASEETLTLAREFVANQRKLLPRGSPLLGPSLLALASLEELPTRHPDEAAALVAEAKAILAQSLAEGAPLETDVIDAMMFFAWSKFVGNVPAEGLVMGEESLKLGYAAYGIDGTGGEGNVFPAHALAWLDVALGRKDEAIKLFEKVIPEIRRRMGSGFPMTLVDVAELGELYRAADRVEESASYLATNLAALDAEATKTTPLPPVAFVRCQFGLTLIRQNRFAEAETVFRQCPAEYNRYRMRPLPLRLHPRARALAGLGHALVGQKKYSEAEPLVLEGFAELQKNASRLAGDVPAMLHDALAAVNALYSSWSEIDATKAPAAALWRQTLENLEATHPRPAQMVAADPPPALHSTP